MLLITFQYRSDSPTACHLLVSNAIQMCKMNPSGSLSDSPRVWVSLIFSLVFIAILHGVAGLIKNLLVVSYIIITNNRFSSALILPFLICVLVIFIIGVFIIFE